MSARLRVEGFTDGATYDGGRPGYPPEAVACFTRVLDLSPGTRVLDLGAGTGKLTRELLGLELELVAVEPSASMRDQLARQLPGVRVLDGVAERIPLPDAGVDVVLVAQAFHWFDAPRALAEIARVLRAGGRLGLVWNERDESVDWVRELSVAMRWHECQPYRVGMDFRPVVTAAGPFGSPERHRFPWHEELDHDRLRLRVASTSYITALSPPERARLMAPVDELIARLPPRIQMPYITELYTFQLL